MRNKLRITAAAAALILLAAGCATDPSVGDPLRVVATTTILGDVAANVAGEDASLETLMPLGASPHDFVPSSQQVAMIYEADLVIANGLELEEGLGDVLTAAQGDGVNILSIGPVVGPLPLTDGDGVDPHVWMDPLRVEEAAAAIAEALLLIDGRPVWQANADGYAVQLRSTHETIADRLGGVAPERRKLVTNHDSLGYFADRYDFDIVGTVIPGGSSLGDPSSAALADLVRVIRQEQVPAIFAETSEPDALAAAVAAEVGSDVAVVQLYTGSLGEPGSGAETLIGLLLTDAERIAEALG